MSQSAKHFLPLKDLFCASFTGNLWVFSSKTWRTFVFRSDDKLLEIGQGPTDTTDTIILRWDVWGCTRGMVICDVPATWIGKKCSTFLVASPSEGWHNFCLVSNFFLKCIIRVLIRFIMGIFFLMESQPIWIVDIPSKIKLCVVKFDHAIKKNNQGHFPLKKCISWHFPVCVYGKVDLEVFMGPLETGATWWSPKMWLSSVGFGSFGLLTSASGHGNSPFNRGLVAVEGGSSTSFLGQDHLQRATRPKTTAHTQHTPRGQSP